MRLREGPFVHSAKAQANALEGADGKHHVDADVVIKPEQH